MPFTCDIRAQFEKSQSLAFAIDLKTFHSLYYMIMCMVFFFLYKRYYVSIKNTLRLHIKDGTFSNEPLHLHNVQDSWLGAYWKWLWAMQISKKVVLFRWLLVHYEILVKSWMQGHPHDLKCDSCGFPIGAVHHILWVCPIARAIWKTMLRILYLDSYGFPIEWAHH